jgi:hypothetical protein
MHGLRSVIELLLDLADQKGESSFPWSPSNVFSAHLRKPRPLTVLDLTLILSGPTCGRQLSDRRPNVIRLDTLMEDKACKQRGGPRAVVWDSGACTARRSRLTVSRICGDSIQKRLVRPTWCERARYAIDGSEHSQKDQLLAAE